MDSLTKVTSTAMAQEKFTFQAEVSRLLDIVAHSLYSHKEIFLRELISNSSDACDKLRYAALTKADLIKDDADFKIRISVDKKAKTLSISDNGIGMDHDDLVSMLGTIANSGTLAFVKQLSGDEAKDANLIGQFGVGFYSSFMVAGKVEVLTRKAGGDKAWLWISDGTGEFTIDAAERDGRGTTVTLYLNKDEKEFLEELRIRTIVKTYSDHIAVPIVFEGKEGEQTLNEASALWIRPKKDISDDQYKEFYHHVSHHFDDPWLTLHNRVEGVMSYTNLLFVPSTPPFDLFNPERKQHIKLYANRVFITDDCEGLMPAYLRFLSGVVDSEDISLNISREMLQQDPKLKKIRSGLVKRVFGELKKKAEKAPDEYATFWENFGAVLKEGVYEEPENREKLLELCRFRSTESDGLVSLKEYTDALKEGQEAIYYITGEDLETVRKSPQLEGFRSRGINVLLLTDPVDEFWVPAVGTYGETPFKSAAQSGADLSQIKDAGDDGGNKDEDKKETAGLDQLIAAFKVALGEAVKDVRVSERLTDSPVCLVSDEGDMGIRLERMLKQHQQLNASIPRVMEINGDHSLIRQLAGKAEKDPQAKAVHDAAHLLLDQARIVEGEQVPDAAAFAERLALMMESAL